MYPETIEGALKDLRDAVRDTERTLTVLFQDVGYDNLHYVTATRALRSLRETDTGSLTETMVYAAADRVGAAFDARERGEDMKALPNEAVVRCARQGQDVLGRIYEAGKTIQVLS